MAKKLLEEATVRRFMKIAGLQPLSEGFVDKLEENEELEESTELEEGADLEEKEDKKDKKELEEGAELEEGEELEEGADLEEKEEKDKKAKKEKMEENLEEMYKEEEPGMEDAEAASEPEMDGEEEVEMEAPPEEMGDEDKPDSDVQGRIMDVIKQLADLADLELEMEEEGGEEDAADDMAPEAPEDMGDEEVMEEGEHMEEPAEDPAHRHPAWGSAAARLGRALLGAGPAQREPGAGPPPRAPVVRDHRHLVYPPDGPGRGCVRSRRTDQRRAARALRTHRRGEGSVRGGSGPGGDGRSPRGG